MASNQQGADRSSRRNPRGFAAMDEEAQRRIAQKGGRASAARQKRDAHGQFAGSSGSSGSRTGGQGGGPQSGRTQGGGSSNR